MERISSIYEITKFSIERFKADIAEGDCCFICGTDPTDAVFNDEHILSNWILRDFSLHNKSITLPNLTEYSYGQYVIPCCEKCNTIMGRYFEQEIRPQIGSYKTFLSFLEKVGPKYILNWLSLIYTKTHLKDNLVRAVRDDRLGDRSTIANKYYDYEKLHHIHCLARSFYTNAEWGTAVYGSIYIGMADTHAAFEKFDFVDNLEAKAILLRMNDFFIIAIFNDAGAVSNQLRKSVLGKLTIPLSPLQIREVFARFCHCSLSLKEKPTFFSFADSGTYSIQGLLPTSPPTFTDFDMALFGELIWNYCRHYVEKSENFCPEMEAQMRSGILTFLFDNMGKVRSDSITFEPKKADA